MGKRKHLGLIFIYNERWIGGTYYLINLIKGLNTLDDSIKPLISIITERKKDFIYVKSETNYPYLKYIKSYYSVFIRFEKVFSLYLINKLINLFRIKNNFDLVFPNPSRNYFVADETKKCYWIPDFQEDHFHYYFDSTEIIRRKQEQIEIAVKAKKIILSSNDVKNDFIRLYPFSKSYIKVLPFAVTHHDFFEVSFEALKIKYKITKDYFFCPNQFWIHKDHQTLIDAINF